MTGTRAQLAEDIDGLAALGICYFYNASLDIGVGRRGNYVVQFSAKPDRSGDTSRCDFRHCHCNWIRRASRTNTERSIQANVIFAVLVPPLGEISAAAERALSDPRIGDAAAFRQALLDQDPVFDLPMPEVMLQVFDRLHLLPNPVAVELASLYSDLLGWRRFYETMAKAAGLALNRIKGMPSIFERINTTASKIVPAARRANLPTAGVEDIA